MASVDHLYQYDTWASNVEASQILIAVNDGFADPITSNITLFWLMALAPDNKIYISTASSTPYLHVINNPDSLGLACDLCQHCITLPALNAFTMPNFPNYYLGAETGSACDSLGVGVHEVASVKNNISIYPNPSRDNATVRFNISSPAQLEVYNNIGEIVYYRSLLSSENNIEIDLYDFKNGVYSCKLTQEGKIDIAQLIVLH